MHATELFQALYFKGANQGTEASAIIYSIRANGLMVFIPKYPTKTTTKTTTNKQTNKQKYTLTVQMYGLRGSVYLRDKEGKLLIPANAFSKNPNEYTSGIVANDYRLSSDVSLVLDTNKGPVEIKLFNRIFAMHAVIAQKFENE
jgi:hypothetical protein